MEAYQVITTYASMNVYTGFLLYTSLKDLIVARKQVTLQIYLQNKQTSPTEKSWKLGLANCVEYIESSYNISAKSLSFVVA